MRKLRLLIVVTMVFSVCYSVSTASIVAERVTFADGRVSFVPPANLKRWTKEQIAKKYFRGNPPQHVFANESGTVSAAITFSPGNAPPDKLLEFKEAMEKMLPRMIPNLEWKTREIIALNGKEWIHLEIISTAIDTDIHNHLYLTSFEGKGLIFGFNSTVEEYPKVEASLLESVKTIKVVE